MHVDAPVVFREAFQELFEEFQEHAELFQRSSSVFMALQEKFFAGSDVSGDLVTQASSFSSYSEFLTSFSEDLHGFQAQWQAATVYRKSATVTDHVVALKQELEQLRESQNQLEQDKYAREALLAGAFSQAYACTSALLDLQNNHDDLTSDLRQLEYALLSFQQALQKGELSVRSDLYESAEAEHVPESDRQAVREALQENTRKRAAQVLRKRFGKVPRRAHQLLKTIDVSSRLDKFFELSLETESLDAFVHALEQAVV